MKSMVYDIMYYVYAAKILNFGPTTIYTVDWVNKFWLKLKKIASDGYKTN